MKKVLSIVASLLALVLVLTACSSKTSDKKEDKKIEENGKKIYKGTIGGEIESNDLFYKTRYYFRNLCNDYLV